METTAIREISLEDVMGDRFGRYSKYIIQDRALPDIRDGLKPVQRRILYAMYMDNNTSDKAFRKSAKTVGNVIANYHPHGDSSVYNAMVRLSQDWKLRETLVEMHGNNGSMDGDSAAAMRYTEARLSKVSDELLKDIDKDTVEFMLNFDDSTEEPTVLPARFPNLLINGATGISAGYATEIPTHNLGEVIDATVHLLTHKKASVKDLMQYVQGPDFPTGGIIQGLEGLREAYETGRGKIIVRSKTEITSLRGGREQIVISEIPFEVNKAVLVKRMDEIRLNKKIDGISEVRDESDRNGLQIVVELKKDANAQSILNYLLKNTDLQISYNFNMVAINHRRPEQVGLLDILTAYIGHQKDVILKRTQYDLAKAKARLHIVDGLIKALSILDEVIATIRSSSDKRDAKNNLVDQYQFTQEQAEAIVSLQLYRLTNTDITALQNEKLDLNETVATLTLIASDDKVLEGVLKRELLDIKKRFNTPRLTQIQAKVEEIKIETHELIAQEDVHLLVTRGGYFKRVSQRSVSAANGQEAALRDQDELVLSHQATTHQTLLAITSKGNYIHLPVHEVPEGKWKELGAHISQQISLDSQETIVFATVLEQTPAKKLVLLSDDGMIKQTDLSEFVTFRSYKTKTAMAMKLKEGARLVTALLVEPKEGQEIVLLSYRGFALRYALDEVPTVGTKAAGVKSMNLKEGDQVVGAFLYDESLEPKGQCLIVTQRGSAKRLYVSEISRLGRAKRGIMVLKEVKANPYRIAAVYGVLAKGDSFLLTSSAGESLELQATSISLFDRLSNGSQLFKEGELAFVRAKQVAGVETE